MKIEIHHCSSIKEANKVSQRISHNTVHRNKEWIWKYPIVVPIKETNKVSQRISHNAVHRNKGWIWKFVRASNRPRRCQNVCLRKAESRGFMQINARFCHAVVSPVASNEYDYVCFQKWNPDAEISPFTRHPRPDRIALDLRHSAYCWCLKTPRRD